MERCQRIERSGIHCNGIGLPPHQPSLRKHWRKVNAPLPTEERERRAERGGGAGAIKAFSRAAPVTFKFMHCTSGAMIRCAAENREVEELAGRGR